MTRNCTFFVHWGSSRKRRCWASGDALLPLRNLGDQLPSIVQTLFEKADLLRVPLSLFASVRAHTPSMYIEAQLLMLTQALEVFSRITRSSKYVTDVAYETVRLALVAAIPSGTDESLKTSLETKLEFGNQHAFAANP